MIQEAQSVPRLETVDDLRLAIEALADGPPYHSKHARTARNTIHSIIQNGVLKKERDETAPERGLGLMLSDSFLVATELRRAIKGPAALVWRIEPEWDHNHGMGPVSTYMRLCFEPI